MDGNKKESMSQALEAISTLDSDVISSVLEKQEADKKKLIGFKLCKELEPYDTALTRKEKKALKKKKISISDIEMIDVEDENFDTILDAMIELRGVVETDEIDIGMWSVWLTKIVGRTLNPLDYEGN